MWVCALIVLLASGVIILGTEGEAWEDGNVLIRKATRGAILVVAISLPIDILIPSKSTMYAMTALSLGEKLAETPTAKGLAADAAKAVQIWIDKQIAAGSK
jgi:hypothetical protein